MPSDIEFTVYKGSKSGEIVQTTYKRGPLEKDEVFVAVTASGLCGTDLHYRTKDMGLGHEGAGVVKATGPDVKYLKVGQRVGWGFLHESCGHCQQCLSGKDTFCPERHFYGTHELHQGSFGNGAVWRESYLFQLPDDLADEDAAPLQCGGATVFNALRMYDTQPTQRVGIIGVGGLGHLAIQFASKMGCDTVVFSGTDSKRDEAMKLGASAFFATKDKDRIEIGRKIDVLLVTTSALPNWKLYLPLMNTDSRILPLSVAGGDLVIPYMPLVLNGISVQGSIVAPRHIHREMLDFAARHKIKPVNMNFKLDKEGIEQGMKTLDEGKMRYRGVLTLPSASRL